MLILGLVFLAAAAVAAVELVLANHGTIDVHMWRWTWQIDAFWLVVAGAAILLVALLGLGLLKASGKRSRRVRRERKDLTAENRRLAQRADVAQTTTSAPAARPVATQPQSPVPTQAPPAATWSPPAGASPPAGGAPPAGGVAPAGHYPDQHN